jgi:hypothetical protein
MAFGQKGAVYGSTVQNLSPAILPAPNRVCRVIPATVWFRKVFPRWREHLAQAMIGVHRQMPRLAPRGSPFTWFTDQESLEGMTDPAQIARRLSFSHVALDACTRYGCIIIEFRIPDQSRVSIPPAAPGTVAGRTHRGAREWIYNGRIELSAQKNIIYLDPNGPMYYYIPLD